MNIELLKILENDSRLTYEQIGVMLDKTPEEVKEEIAELRSLLERGIL